MMKIVLVGFMGSGKSTVGKILSEKLSIPFRDLDSIIVENTGMSIPEIFQNKGETAFRELERFFLLSELSKKTNFILSTGGGTPAYKDNMEKINQSGISIFLYADFETLYNRISGDKNRPLTSLSKEELKELYKKRLPFYRKALFTVNTTGKTPEEVVNEIFLLTHGGKDKSNR